MKVKTSVTLSADVAQVTDSCSDGFKNRSDMGETAVPQLIAQIKRGKQNARDLAIINRHAERLNREALDVLIHQAPL